jgi:hypothetical protein
MVVDPYEPWPTSRRRLLSKREGGDDKLKVHDHEPSRVRGLCADLMPHSVVMNDALAGRGRILPVALT